MNAAEVRIRRSIARHGIAVTLVQNGVSYAIQILSRRAEGAMIEPVAGMPTQLERYLIPAYAVPVPIEAYAMIQFGGRNRTISKVDPGYYNGEIVRWDVECGG